MIIGQMKNGAIAKGNIRPDSKAINLGCEINFWRGGITIPIKNQKKKALGFLFDIINLLICD